MSVDRLAAIFAAILLALGIAAGFWLIGSPAHRRSIAEDEQRQSDLSQIVRGVRERPEIPRDLRVSTTLRPDGTNALADPASEIPYEYRRLSKERFRVCATFDANAEPGGETYSYVPELRDHGSGHQCFVFEK
jgi:hypothetical protein